ncbi:ribokinase [Tropicimonas sp. IMCC6043]|uniref:ribokinase n=1 Tax=Tropicimonas sp. IMCC6043 TaxID=2510645 RepID=UPI00101DC2E8|nr:ribokinase [Tropicimonas sp. IMCC6043]RYH08647.1 ribokinase [Tropicimonas sp. IMCC6043]
MPIAIFGSINIDLTAYAERLPRPGETVHGERYALGLGGKGCNQAVAACRLGAETALVGRIGTDEFGNRALAELAALKVPTGGVFRDAESATGIAVIGVDATAQNCITVIGGANMAIGAADVERAAETFRGADILLLQMEIPLEAGLLAADLVRETGGEVILDPAPAPAGGYATDVLARIDLITPNETETELLTGLRPTNAAEAAEAAGLLRAKGAGAAVVKLGAAGVFYQDAASEGFVEPFKVESIDSVAAGDCFNGGLAVALSEGRPLGEAVRFAAACGALSTTKAGASSSAPTRAEVEALLKRG